MKRLILPHKLLILFLLALSGCVAQSVAPDFASRREAQEIVDNGTLLLREGELSRAQAAFEASWAIAPSPQALDGLGCVAFLKGETKEAEELFTRALTLDEEYSHALGNLALLYESEGNHEKAKELYERGLIQEPKNFQARNNYGVFLEESGDSDTARGEILRAEAISGHPLIVENVSRIGF